MSNEVTFLSRKPRLDEYWRGIVLFGNNVASYKFALAQSLLELKPQSGQLLKMYELAPVYAKHISRHLKISDKQSTSSTSKFLSACRDHNNDSLSKDRLTDITVQLGFKNVIDAFHRVNRQEIEKQFFIDERRENKGLRITDEFNELITSSQGGNLPSEVDARWRLVERAWELRITRSMVSVGFDAKSKTLFTINNKLRRTTVTSCRDALNGYQKGRCFYCFGAISLIRDGVNFPDVDHFFPNVLKTSEWDLNIDGIWNLVLACKKCNRGTEGKFAHIPTIKLLKRLYRRNEFLINSHHPLRETLIEQTGDTTQKRKKFLNATHGDSVGRLIHTWEPEEIDTPYF